jgi:hypothetical protein
MLFFSHGDGDLSDIGYDPLSNRLMTTGEKFEARRYCEVAIELFGQFCQAHSRSQDKMDWHQGLLRGGIGTGIKYVLSGGISKVTSTFCPNGNTTPWSLSTLPPRTPSPTPSDLVEIEIVVFNSRHRPIQDDILLEYAQ